MPRSHSHSRYSLAGRVAREILDDLHDRSGIGDILDQIAADEETYGDIAESIAQRIHDAYEGEDA